MSGVKRVHTNTVEMHKQIGRHDKEEAGGGSGGIATEDLIGHLNNEAPIKLYENPALTAPILRNARGISRPGDGDGGGARDWGKIPGRHTLDASAAADADAAILGHDLLPQKDQLVLEPVHEANSK